MKNFSNKFVWAISGIIKTFKTEASFRIQVVLALVALNLSNIFKIKEYELILVLILIGLVLSIEVINTSVEKLGDITDKKKTKEMKVVKDTAAGAVLISAIMSLAVGLIIFIPYIKEVIK